MIIFHAEKDDFRSTPAPQMKDAAQPTDHECQADPTGALHAAAVFKLAGSPGFHAVADICLDGAVLYQVHGTKTLCLWDITEHCMRPRFSNWQVPLVFTPSQTSVWMGQYFTKCTGLNPLSVGHFVNPAFL